MLLWRSCCAVSMSSPNKSDGVGRGQAHPPAAPAVAANENSSAHSAGPLTALGERLTLRENIKARYNRWLKKRLPPARTITLEQRRLFIFPSRPGFLFMLTLLLMLLTAINYQNNLAYALTFWLSMLFIVAVHFTHGNLMKLTIAAVSAESVFPGQQAEFKLRLSCRSKKAGHYSVRLVWPGSETLVDIPAGGSVDVSLFQSVGGRGWFHPPRITIESTYPLGLLRCWSYAELDFQALVWPKPIAAPTPPLSRDRDGAVGFSDATGVEDLAGFRDYREGDSPRHVDWRAWARGQELQTREFSAPAREDHWLEWEAFPDAGVEQRLSFLCWLALQYDARGDEYGLRLPGQELPLGAGDRQRELVLRALALYGFETPAKESTHGRSGAVPVSINPAASQEETDMPRVGKKPLSGHAS